MFLDFQLMKTVYLATVKWKCGRRSLFLVVPRSHFDKSPSRESEEDHGMKQPKIPENVSVTSFQKGLMGVQFHMA